MPIKSNFLFLQEHDEQLARLGLQAERYFATDPNTCLLKLRQVTELLARLLAARSGIATSTQEAQFELLQRLQDYGVLPREIVQLFREIRKSGNDANHTLKDDHRTALFKDVAQAVEFGACSCGRRLRWGSVRSPNRFLRGQSVAPPSLRRRSYHVDRVEDASVCS